MIFDVRFLIYDWLGKLKPIVRATIITVFLLTDRCNSTSIVNAQIPKIENRTSETSTPGSITGVVDEPAAALAAVTAVNRSNGKRVAGTIDKDSEKFRIEGLNPGTPYDVILDFKPPAGSKLSLYRLEGASMNVPRSEYEEQQPLSREDIATIKEKVLGLNQFEDVVEILAIDGNIQHAAVLVNKLRTKPFYESKPGEIIWRPELWHFERPDETWVKVQDELFIILYRERIQKLELDKRSVTFDSALGGIRLTSELHEVNLGVIKLSDANPGVRFRGAGAIAGPQAKRPGEKIQKH